MQLHLFMHYRLTAITFKLQLQACHMLRLLAIHLRSHLLTYFDSVDIAPTTGTLLWLQRKCHNRLT